jgi:hypothetical protein
VAEARMEVPNQGRQLSSTETFGAACVAGPKFGPDPTVDLACRC